MIVACIQGDNLSSVSLANITVTVGGVICSNISVRNMEILCNPPSQPPNGMAKAEVRVS